jgi:2-haloacid dehalogenase
MEQAMNDACIHFMLDIPPKKRKALCEEYLTLKVFEEVPEVLSKLKENYKLVILSHGTQRMLDAVAEHNSVTHLFDEILSVDAIQAYKPDLKAYELLIKKIDLPEKSFGYAGVNPMDIAGAKAFGMKTIWIRRNMAQNRLMRLIADMSSADLKEMTIDHL